MLAAGIALAAALCFALSTVSQHRAAVSSPDAQGVGISLLLRLARRPVWLLGLLAGAAGLALHAVALSVGRLAVVQPLLVSGMLFAIPASVLLERRRPSTREWAYACVVAVGLGLFLLAAQPSDGSDLADQGVLGAMAAAGAAVAGGATLLAQGPGWRHRAALLGLAAGISFGVVSALLKHVVGQVAVAPLAVFTTWPFYALLALGIAGTLLTQTSYQAGSLAASQPALNIAEPVVAVTIGAVAFSEGLAVTPSALLGQAAGFLLMAWGVLRLTSLTAKPVGTPPPSTQPYTAEEPTAPGARAGGLSPGAGHDGARRQILRLEHHDRAHGALPRVLVVSGSVGAGHDGAAYELADRLRARGVDVDVRDYLLALPSLCRYFLRDGYTISVKQAPQLFQWLFDAIERSWLVHAAMRALCRLGDRTVRRWTRTHPYDVVVSTYPLASQSLGNLRQRGDLNVPVVTYLTDPAVHRSWVHPAVDHHLTVTSWAARQGTQTYRVAMRPAGPLVPARFGTVDPTRRAALRGELGLTSYQQVALLVTGSLGLGDVEHSARQVLAAGLVPLVLCGRNQALQRRLAAVPGVVALGWRDDVHDLMHAADVLVHNAGGLTFTEAMVAGLPAISYRCIPGHGIANAAALRDGGLAPWAHTDEQFAAALQRQAGRGRTLLVPDDPALHVLSVLRGSPDAMPQRPLPRAAANPAATRADAGRNGRGRSVPATAWLRRSA